jgi:hypothetical protein
MSGGRFHPLPLGEGRVRARSVGKKRIVTLLFVSFGTHVGVAPNTDWIK